MELTSSNRLEAYFQLNRGLYEQTIPGEMYGSRYIVNGLTLHIPKWREPFPILEDFGYPSQAKRLARLKRNYFEEISHDQARDLFNRKFGDTPYTGAPLSFTTNKIKQTGNLGCLVGGAITWKSPNEQSQCVESDFLLRISETVKVLPADLVFLDRCLMYSLNDFMAIKLGTVRIHFAGAYVVPSFFPQLCAMLYSQGRKEKIILQRNNFGKGCYRALEQALDPTYQSKWKPQIRILNFFRKVVPCESTDVSRFLSGF